MSTPRLCLPARSYNKKGNKMWDEKVPCYICHLLFSASVACVFNPSLPHAIAGGIRADCLPQRGAWWDWFCTLLCFWEMVPKASDFAAVVTWEDSCWDDADYRWQRNHRESCSHQLDLRDTIYLNLSKTFTFYGCASWTSMILCMHTCSSVQYFPLGYLPSSYIQKIWKLQSLIDGDNL